MGKKSRRPGREQRKQLSKKRAALGLSSDGLKLVIATAPDDSQGGDFLNRDLQMVRSALLYADSVELLSPTATMVEGVASLERGDIVAWVQLLLRMDRDTLRHTGLDQDVDEMRVYFDRYLALHGMSRSSRRQLLQGGHGDFQTVAREFKSLLVQNRDNLESFIDQQSRDELLLASELGMLTLNTGFIPEDGDPDALADNYAEQLKMLLESPHTYLLLDEVMGNLANLMISEGKVKAHETTVHRSARSRVGTGLIARLPTFPQATVASVLEAREEIVEHLASYRSGVKRLAEHLEVEPFEPSSEVEVEEMWRDEVRPALDRLRYDLSRMRIFRETAFNLGINSGSWVTGGGIFMGLETFSNVGHVFAAGAGASPVVLRAFATAFKESDARRRSARRHELFYLLELDRRL